MALTTAQIQNAYVAFFNRPADVAGLTYWSSYAGSTADLLNTFAQSTEYKGLYSGMNNTQLVNAVYQNLFGHTPDVAGLTYWVTQLDQGKLSIGNIADAINKGAQSTDASIIANKVAAATAFTAALDTTAEVVAYAGVNSTGLTAVKAWLAAVTSDASTVPNTDSVNKITATVVSNGAAITTTALTTSMDNLTGSNGNDVFVADNTAAGKQLSVVDVVNGGLGNDTLKVYLATTDTAVPMATLTSVENLYINGGGAVTADLSGYADVTAVTIDQQGGAGTYTLAGTQAVTVSNDNGTTVQNNTFKYGASVASATVNLNGMGKAGAAGTLDVQGASLATLNIASASAINNISLTASAAPLATLNLSGDKDITIVESITTLKTINAASATGKVSIDASGLGADNNLTFTGGSGNDKLVFKAGYLTAADKLDGGAGTDTLVLQETSSLTSDNYAAINAAKNFEVLGIGASTMAVDLSKVTNGINAIAVAGSSVSGTVTNSLSTTKYSLDSSTNLGTVTVTNKAGETSTSVALDNQDVSTHTVSKLVLNGANTVALSSTGKVSGSTNTITELVTADNSVVTLTGSSDLTLSLKLAATGNVTTGSKIDGSAFTGTLSLTGNTTAAGSTAATIGDILIGGSGNDTLKAAINGGTLTGGAGVDTFDVSKALGHAAVLTTITDLAKGEKILFKDKGDEVFYQTKVDVSGAADLTAAVGLAAAGNGGSNGLIKWFQYDGNTYLVSDQTNGAYDGTADMLVKLTGLVDLSSSSFSGAGTSSTFIYG
ncbi:DUF4214 domain-containing protein [Rivihabitans pingtungensis]|uniref:Uncharacterized protein DUF4214 n=1 Tax=Rivihabitans pingtungensis TaxID=1054498 RepID=A0A318KMS0_9NEIS|nr:DUF4214 domain-containing protein [Rivihabitans pingtungensis]PXX78008.1 uncharacterized protein DUF4214 [Rivihabitans pingtungensis]